MKQREGDEHEHHEVVDDAHAHSATEAINSGLEQRHVRAGRPQAQTGEEHEDDQHRNAQVADLLRNAKLSGQRVIFLEEQVILNPLRALVKVSA